ncbi:MAG TPA: ABC transporter ATP-binding protein, partial [Fibrobacteraceae bacterium]|nr:ABC transporter ATP-binding protein [Fibrobacteraceae bacterium]
LDVREGEIFGFIGPNGAGKSTTIKILVGLLRPTSGDVSVLSHSPRDPEARRGLGFLPEQPYFYDYLTGYELLCFYGTLSGLRGTELKQHIQWALQLLHADHDWIHRRLRTYSKGMMQRVGLAQAILARPRLLILDEPMSGLDPLGRRDVREAILSLNREGCTIFYSSHVLSDVESISHRVAMVIDGAIVRQGTIEEVTAEDGLEYRVRTDKACQNLELAGVRSLSPQEFICAKASVRDQFLSLCVSQGIGVELLENHRPSLEDILTREVSKEGVHG